MVGDVSRRGVLEAIAYLGAVGPLGQSSAVGAADELPGMSWPMFKKGPRNRGELTADFVLPLTKGWRTEPGGTPTAPVVADKSVYAGTTDGAAHALDLVTGDGRWSAELDGGVTAPPAVADGTLVVGTDGGSVYGLSTADGSEQWRYDAGAAVTAGTTIEGNTAYVGTDGGSVHAVDVSSGTAAWSRGTSEARVTSVPAVEDGTVYVTTGKGQVVALDGSSRQWTARFQRSLLGAPVVLSDILVVGTDVGALFALSLTNGDRRWNDGLDGVHAGSPSVKGNLLYVGTSNGTVTALNQSGGLFGTRRTDREIVAPVVPTDAGVLALTSGGELLTVELASGSVEQTAVAGFDSSQVSAVAAGQNGMFFTAADRVQSVFNPDSLAVRQRLRELDDAVAAARSDGVDVRRSSEYRADAVEQFRKGNYERARAIAEDGLAYVDRRREQLDDAREARAQLKRTIADARDDGLVVDTVEENYLQPVNQLIEDGNYEDAISKAESGQKRVQELRTQAEAARTAIDDLAAAITDCESSLSSVKLPEVEAALETARAEYDDGKYAEAETTAADATDLLERRCRAARQADEAIANFRSTVESAAADGVVVDEERALLEQATRQYENGEYEAALETIDEARQTLQRTERARKEAKVALRGAKLMHNKQRRVHLMAEWFDDDGLLATARRQYENGEYVKAKENAKAARRNARLTIRMVDAGYFVTGSGVVIWLTDAPGKVSGWVSDRFGDD